ncbi:MAG: hypothetical protein VSS75_032675 [Candidatus Parabeggiatoa sp.]|nr:hypothetical protein [Candidatus Parabeggiatoa sp.]
MQINILSLTVKNGGALKDVKIDLGQRCAAPLGLEPGPLGKDAGIDGVGFINQQKIYFQSKLINLPLNAEFADFL